MDRKSSIRTEKPYLQRNSLQERYPELWAILVQKGYQGVAELLRELHPTKTPLRTHTNTHSLAPAAIHSMVVKASTTTKAT